MDVDVSKLTDNELRTYNIWRQGQGMDPVTRDNTQTTFSPEPAPVVTPISGSSSTQQKSGYLNVDAIVREGMTGQTVNEPLIINDSNQAPPVQNKSGYLNVDAIVKEGSTGQVVNEPLIINEPIPGETVTLSGGVQVDKASFEKLPVEIQNIGRWQGFNAMDKALKDYNRERLGDYRYWKKQAIFEYEDAKRMVEAQDNALLKLQDFRVKVYSRPHDEKANYTYSYDLPGFLRKGGDPRILRVAGFTPEDIRAAEDWNNRKMSLDDFSSQYYADHGWDYGKERSLVQNAADKFSQINATSGDNLQRFREYQDYKIHQDQATDAYIKKYGKGDYFGSMAGGALTPIFTPAKALSPEITIKDVSGMDWALGGAQVALFVVAPVAGAAIKGTAGTIVTKGLELGAGAVFTKDTVDNWKNMSSTERAISVAMDTLIIGSALPKGAIIKGTKYVGGKVVEGSKAAGKTLTTGIEQAASGKAPGFFRLDPTGKVSDSIAKAVESRGDKLTPEYKAKLDDAVTRLQEAASKAIETKQYGDYIQATREMEALAKELKPYPRQELLRQIRRVASNPQEALGIAETIGKTGEAPKIIENNSQIMDELTNILKQRKVESPKAEGDIIKISDYTGEATYKAPMQHNPENLSLEQKLEVQAQQDRLTRLIEKEPGYARERYYKALQKQGEDREEAIKEMIERLEERYGKKELENYLKTGDWEAKEVKPSEEFLEGGNKPEKPTGDLPDRGNMPDKGGRVAVKEKVKTEELTEAEKEALRKIKEKTDPKTKLEEDIEKLVEKKDKTDKAIKKLEDQIKKQEEDENIRRSIRKQIEEKKELPKTEGNRAKTEIKTDIKPSTKTATITITKTETSTRPFISPDVVAVTNTSTLPGLKTYVQLQEELNLKLKDKESLQTALKTKLQEQTKTKTETKTSITPKPGEQPKPGTENKPELKKLTKTKTKEKNKKRLPKFPEMEDTEAEKPIPVKPGTLAWQQGALDVDKSKPGPEPVYKVAQPPKYRVETQVDNPPAGYKNTGKTPKATIQVIGGPVKKDVSVDLGATTAHAEANEKKITFTSNRARIVEDHEPEKPKRNNAYKPKPGNRFIRKSGVRNLGAGVVRDRRGQHIKLF